MKAARMRFVGEVVSHTRASVDLGTTASRRVVLQALLTLIVGRRAHAVGATAVRRLLALVIRCAGASTAHAFGELRVELLDLVAGRGTRGEGGVRERIAAVIGARSAAARAASAHTIAARIAGSSRAGAAAAAGGIAAAASASAAARIASRVHDDTAAKHKHRHRTNRSKSPQVHSDLL
jgi:hypothetical protein